MKRLLVALVVAGLLVGIPVYAHHSFAAQYFEDQTMSIEGELVEFEYRSPHAWVHVMAKDQKGQMQRFSAEWSNPNRLSQQSIGKDTLKPGDRVIISGSPARNVSEHKLHLKQIERPADGWKWNNNRRRRQLKRAEEAIRIYEQYNGPIHLLSDIVMQNMSGVELAETLTRQNPTLKALLMSGYPDER